ncbi:MAG: adenylate/guanylate cyclase domain-containing protein [bacterium]
MELTDANGFLYYLFMKQSQSHAAVLFADLVRSTSLYKKLGDAAAQKIVAACLAGMEKVTREYGGEVIKTIGDEVMSVFPSADQAVQAGVRMHQVVEGLPVEDVSEPVKLHLHIGIHTGLVVQRQGDVFGDAVNLAARMTHLANPRQIIFSTHTADQLKPELRQWLRPIGTETIKGKSGSVQAYEYLWDRTDTTVIRDRIETPRVGNACLEIRFADCMLRVDQDQPECTIGRHEDNDIVLNYERISRFHAKIEQRRCKYVLSDHSFNGTYIEFAGKKEVYLNRDEIELTGSGIISPGRKASPGSPGAIHFKHWIGR